MKKLLGPLVLATAALALGTVALRAKHPTYSAPPRVVVPEHIPAMLEAPVAADQKLVRFDVQGMCCSGCTGKLYAAAKAVPDVEDVAVDPVLHHVDAVVPSSFDVARLTSALTFDEYTAKPSE